MKATQRKRSNSVPPSFRFQEPDKSQPVVKEDVVYEFLPKEEISTKTEHGQKNTIQQKARYRLFPDAVAPFLHSFNDEPSEVTSDFHNHVHEVLKCWHKKDKLHRKGVNNPAYVRERGTSYTCKFYQNGYLHRGMDLPARIIIHGTFLNYDYFFKGIRHRWSGPANYVCNMDSSRNIKSSTSYFWLFGKPYDTIEEFYDAKFKYATKEMEAYSTFHDEVVPKIENVLNRQTSNPQYHIVPNNVLQNIKQFAFYSV